jgi:hypothetical protein
MYPSGRVGLEHAKQIGHGSGGRNGEQEVNMVCRSVDDEGRRIHLSDNAAHIREQPAGKLRRESGRPVLGGEDHVNEKTGKSMRHGSYAPIRGYSKTGGVPDGLRRGLLSSALRAYGCYAEDQCSEIAVSRRSGQLNVRTYRKRRAARMRVIPRRPEAALSISPFERSRWRLRRTRQPYGKSSWFSPSV